MRKLALLLCVLLCFPFLSGMREETECCDIVVAADLHYISPSLTDGGAAFTELIGSGDGKVMHQIEALSDAFLDEVIERRPDALLLLGDLTFNGALESHRALAEKLRRVEEAGVPVLVTTGNHDLDNPNAAAFFGESIRRVPSADSETFREIYAAFGYDEALSVDGDSLSYVFRLKGKTRLLMLDCNAPGHSCALPESTLPWIEKELEAAREAGERVIAAGHQNLLQQTIFRGGYVLECADALLSLFARYEVPLYLSGHLHVQHWKSERGVTEIAGSALSVSPCQYGLLRMRDGQLVYETHETDVAAWAAAHGRSEPELLDFAAGAAAFFDTMGQAQLVDTLRLFGRTEEEVACMSESFRALNRAYFSGDMRDAAAAYAPAAGLWEDDPSLYGLYVRSIREDFGRDFRRWQSGGDG